MIDDKSVPDVKQHHVKRASFERVAGLYTHARSGVGLCQQAQMDHSQNKVKLQRSTPVGAEAMMAWQTQNGRRFSLPRLTKQMIVPATRGFPSLPEA